ncbi:MAG: hypothetical protein ACLFWD_05815, partial [Anaerolineales bacterium]
DLPLLHRLRNHGQCFDARQAFTRGINPLQSALLDAITPGWGDLSLVAPHSSKRALTAVGQVSHHPHHPIAHLTFLGPTSAIDEDNGLRLLDALARSVGERGGHHLIAEVDEDSAAFVSMRRAGFAVYARQRIWRVDNGGLETAETESHRWRKKSAQDEFAITRLYLNLVPALVQQVEPPPTNKDAGWVHWHQDELHGYLDLDAGRQGVWAHPYLHPAAQDHEQLLAAAFNKLAQEYNRPLYICIRSYQGWMNAALERMRLSRCADQAVMVKRLAASLHRHAEAHYPQIEATSPEPSAPFSASTRHETARGVEQPTP